MASSVGALLRCRNVSGGPPPLSTSISHLMMVVCSRGMLRHFPSCLVIGLIVYVFIIKGRPSIGLMAVQPKFRISGIRRPV